MASQSCQKKNIPQEIFVWAEVKAVYEFCLKHCASSHLPVRAKLCTQEEDAEHQVAGEKQLSCLHWHSSWNKSIAPAVLLSWISQKIKSYLEGQGSLTVNLTKQKCTLEDENTVFDISVAGKFYQDHFRHGESLHWLKKVLTWGKVTGGWRIIHVNSF